MENIIQKTQRSSPWLVHRKVDIDYDNPNVRRLYLQEAGNAAHESFLQGKRPLVLDVFEIFTVKMFHSIENKSKDSENVVIASFSKKYYDSGITQILGRSISFRHILKILCLLMNKVSYHFS
jgi:hypothetical protein